MKETTVFKKLVFILEPGFRKRAKVLQVYLLIALILESISLGLIVPLANAVFNTHAARSGQFAIITAKLLPSIPGADLWLITLIAFVLFYLGKTFFLSFVVWKQASFTQNLSENISQRLFAGYIHQPHSFFFERNTAILMRNTTAEVGSFTAFIQSVMFIQAEFAVFIGILVALFLMEPIAALVVCAFIAVVSLLLVQLTKKKVSGWGRDRQLFDGYRSRSLLQGLSGVMEIQLSGNQSFFETQYKRFSSGFYNSQLKIQFISQVQRYFFECLLILGMASVCCVSMAKGLSAASLLPAFSLFLVAALRLLPSVNRIVANAQSVRFARPAIGLLYAEFKLFEASMQNTLPAGTNIKSSLRLEQISYQYPGAEQPVLKNVTLELNRGAVIGLYGPNGSGKTTLVNIVAGMLTPQKGKVLIDDIEMSRHGVMPGCIGYVPQTIFLLDDSIKKNIAFGIAESSINNEQLETAIGYAQLNEVIAGLPMGLDTVVGERGLKLSGGQRQRIAIARALYSLPELLILDEGTNALDGETEAYFIEAIRRLRGIQVAVLFISHRPSALAVCDRIYTLENGTLHENTVDCV